MSPELEPFSTWSLLGLLDPVSSADYFADHFEKRPLHVARSKPGHFDGLVTLDDIDRIVTTLDLRHPGVALAEAGTMIEPTAFSDEDGRLDAARLFARHADGATLIVNRIDDMLAPAAELCAALELEFSALVQANFYISPPNSVGFAAHFDTHDVFVLQTHGRKTWRLYRSPIELPLAVQAEALDDAGRGALLDEVELVAGDTLYLPRGVVHEAAAGDQVSAHLTVGLLAYTWTDLIYEALAGVALGDPAFRAALPRAFAGAAFDRVQAAQTLEALIGRLAARADLDGAFEAVRAEFLAARRQRLRGQMGQLAALTGLSPESWVAPRPHLAVALRDEATALVVACYGKEIRIPRIGAEAVRFALSTPRYRVCDLPGQLDSESRLAVVRRLVREGLLVMEPPIACGQGQA